MNYVEILDNVICYILERVDRSGENGLSVTGWVANAKRTGIPAPEIEMVEAFFHFLRMNYFLQINYDNCGKNGEPHPHFRMRKSKRVCLEEGPKRYKLIKEFIEVYE